MVARLLLELEHFGGEPVDESIVVFDRRRRIMSTIRCMWMVSAVSMQ